MVSKGCPAITLHRPPNAAEVADWAIEGVRFDILESASASTLSDAWDSEFSVGLVRSFVEFSLTQIESSSTQICALAAGTFWQSLSLSFSLCLSPSL